MKRSLKRILISVLTLSLTAGSYGLASGRGELNEQQSESEIGAEQETESGITGEADEEEETLPEEEAEASETETEKQEAPEQKIDPEEDAENEPEQKTDPEADAENKPEQKTDPEAGAENGPEEKLESGTDQESGQESEDAEKVPELTETDRLAGIHREDLEDGIYFIRSGLSNSKVLDIRNKSLGNKAVSVIRQFSKEENQKWEVVHDEKGYVTFLNRKSSKALDVDHGMKKSGTQVWQYHSNGSMAQKWIAVKEGAGYKIISALDPELVLDVRNGKAADNTQLQIYRSNNSKAQRFYFVPLDPAVETCEEVVPSGYYYLKTKKNSGYAVDIKGGSNANKANVQLYRGNQSFAQSFFLQYKDGYYTIRNAYSGKMLDAAGGGYMPGTNVWQYSSNGSKAQKWSVRENEDGTFTFISAHNGLALDIAGGRVQSGGNMQLYTPNHSDAQKFILEEAKDFYGGKYTLTSALVPSKAIEIQGGKVVNKTNIQLYRSNGTESQKWIVRENEDATYSFINIKSGKVLDVAGAKGENGNNVQSYTSNGTAAQKWKIEALGDGTWRIVSLLDEKLVLGIEQGKTADRSNINIQTWKNAKHQKWIFNKTASTKKVVLNVSVTGGTKRVMDKSEKLKLQAEEILLTGAKGPVTWSSSDSSVLSVTGAGVVTAKRSGNAVITAASKTDKNITAQIRVYVKEEKGQLTKKKLDSLNLGKIKKLMIVAHPDDETFWGGGHLLKDDYFVVCITNGWNSVRRKEFERAVKYSKDVGLILDYPDLSDGRRDNWEYVNRAIKKDIELLVGYKKWETIVTHNPDGEYGHIHHKMLDQYTTKICKDNNQLGKLYYFGKYWKKGEIPSGTKSNLSVQILKKKNAMVQLYVYPSNAYQNNWAQMQPYEYWVRAAKWK